VKRDELNERVGAELERTPPGQRGSTQNFFRAAYNMMRRHDLSVNPTTPLGASFERALKEVRKTSPDFVPISDRQFFGV